MDFKSVKVIRACHETVAWNSREALRVLDDDDGLTWGSALGRETVDVVPDV